LSLAGDQRELVQAIAQAVEDRLGRGRVFLEEWFEHYIAGDDADLKLQEIYARRCECRSCASPGNTYGQQGHPADRDPEHVAAALSYQRRTWKAVRS